MSDTESGGGSVPISLEWQDFRFLNTVDNMSWNLKKRKKQERNLLMIQDSCRAGRDNRSQTSRNRPNTKWDVASGEGKSRSLHVMGERVSGRRKSISPAPFETKRARGRAAT